MSKHIEVIPGIFEKVFSKIEERVKLVSPFVDWIQIDLADNKLVSNSSVDNPTLLKQMIIESNAKFELHMMVENPLDIAHKWIDVGFKRLLFHIEGIHEKKHLELKIQEFQKLGIEVGLAVDKNTLARTIYPYLEYIDCALVMTIAAGFSGQAFVPKMLDKVTDIRKEAPKLPIEIDGGVTFETAKLAVDAGATRLVSTSTLFNAVNLQEAIEKMKTV